MANLSFLEHSGESVLYPLQQRSVLDIVWRPSRDTVFQMRSD